MYANLFLVDRTVQSKDILLASLNANTTYVEFEPLVDTYASLKEKIVAKIAENGTPFTHIALAQHSTMDTMYSILRTSAPLNLEDVAPYASWNEVKTFLGEIKALGISTFDFLACSIYRHVNMQSIFAHLESESGLNLRASINFTGNFEQGGDWILESDNADIRGLYFNDLIEQYSDLFVSSLLGGGVSTSDVKFINSSGIEWLQHRTNGATLELRESLPQGKTIKAIAYSIYGYAILFTDNTIMTVRLHWTGSVATTTRSVTYQTVPAGRIVTGMCSDGQGSYCIIMDDGSIMIWGNYTTPTLPDNIKIVKSLLPTGKGVNFILLTNTGMAYIINSTNDHYYGSQPGYIVDKIASINDAISLIYTNGLTNYTELPTLPPGVGVKDIIKIGQQQQTFIALLTDNTIVTWKNFTSSTSVNILDTSLLTGKTVKRIYADFETAVLLLNDDTIVCCGRKTYGGVTPTLPEGVSVTKIIVRNPGLTGSIAILLSNGTILNNASGSATFQWTTVSPPSGKSYVDFCDTFFLLNDGTVEPKPYAFVYNSSSNPLPLTYPSNKYLKQYLPLDILAGYGGALFNSVPHAPVTGISSITSPKSFSDFYTNEQIQLSCSVIPANAEDTLIRWYSSNENVLTVTQSGLVTCHTNGNVTVTAVSRDGDFMATCDIAISNVPITGISPIIAANPSQLNLHTLALVNATLQLTATTSPTNGTNKSITWTSSNPAIASVSETGLVTALARGITYITATTVDGGYTSYPYSINVDVQTTTGTVSNVTVNTTAVSSNEANTIRNYISSTTASATTSIGQIKADLGATSDTQIAKSPAVTSGTNIFQAAIADITAISTMYDSGTSVKLASTPNAAVDTFIPSTPDVATIGVVLTETKVSSSNPTISAVTIAVAKLDANNNRILSSLTDPTTFDTVVVTLPKTAYLKITHLGGTYESTNQVYTDVSNTTIGAIDLTTAYIGKLYTFTSAVVPYVNNIKVLVLDVTLTTVKVAYTGPFSETIFEPSTAPPPDTLISTEVFNPASIACFPTGTRILTPSGYKAVETLKTGDSVTTADGRTVTGKVYCTKIASTTQLTAPYRIKAGTFKGQVNDLCVSPLHAIQKAKGIWEIPEMAAKRYSTIEQYGVGETVTYYHVEAPNFYTDNLVAEGVTVESYAGKQVSLPKGTPLYKFNAKINGFTRYTPSKSAKKN